MTLVSSSHLTALRATQADSMDQTCTIRTLTPGASDGAGGFLDDTATTVDVACRVSKQVGREDIITDKVSAETTYWITVPYGTAIAQTSEIVCNGRTYQVIDRNADNSWKTAERVLARITV